MGLFGAISIIFPFLVAVYTLLKERRNQKTIEEVVFRIIFLLIWLDLGISVSNVAITVIGMAFLGIILGGEIIDSTNEVKRRIRFLFLPPLLFMVAFGQSYFALDSTQLDREILKLQMKPINLNSAPEIDLRVKDLITIANNPKILNSESVVIAQDVEALKAIRLEISSGG
jgi:hypothetical protein